MTASNRDLWGLSLTGHKRATNEDRYLIRRLEAINADMLAVADGMGGEVGGAQAAQMVIEALERADINPPAIEQRLSEILEASGEMVRQKAREDIGLEGMGTTATVVVAIPDTAFWSHVGDSRLYLFRSGVLSQITTDHTFVQDLIDDGTLTQKQAERHPLRNMLDQCVGCASLKPDMGQFSIQAGDRLLVCSDGLTGHVSDDGIRSLLEGGDARQVVNALTDQALQAGGKDNITVIVMDILRSG